MNDERLESSDRLRIESRLRTWVAAHIAAVLGPLAKAAQASVSAPVRGIVFHLTENSGAVARVDVEAQLAALSKEEREALARLGIRFGVEYVFMPALMKAAPIRLRGLLWIAAHRGDDAPALPPPGRVTFPITAVPLSFLTSVGYRAISGRAYRLDMVERFAAVARRLAREKVKQMPPEHLSLLGVSADEGVHVLKALGFKAKAEETGLIFAPRRRGKPHRAQAAEPLRVREDSPFAKLRELMPTP